jgi:hypothetical protein
MATQKASPYLSSIPNYCMAHVACLLGLKNASGCWDRGRHIRTSLPFSCPGPIQIDPNHVQNTSERWRCPKANCTALRSRFIADKKNASKLHRADIIRACAAVHPRLAPHLLGHLQWADPSGPGAFNSVRADRRTGRIRSSGANGLSHPPRPIGTTNLGNRCVGADSTRVHPRDPRARMAAAQRPSFSGHQWK